jgi:hypothetical protein
MAASMAKCENVKLKSAIEKPYQWQRKRIWRRIGETRQWRSNNAWRLA